MRKTQADDKYFAELAEAEAQAHAAAFEDLTVVDDPDFSAEALTNVVILEPGGSTRAWFNGVDVTEHRYSVFSGHVGERISTSRTMRYPDALSLSPGDVVVIDNDKHHPGHPRYELVEVVSVDAYKKPPGPYERYTYKRLADQLNIPDDLEYSVWWEESSSSSWRVMRHSDYVTAFVRDEPLTVGDACHPRSSDSYREVHGWSPEKEGWGLQSQFSRHVEDKIIELAREYRFDREVYFTLVDDPDLAVDRISSSTWTGLMTDYLRRLPNAGGAWSYTRLWPIVMSLKISNCRNYLSRCLHDYPSSRCDARGLYQDDLPDHYYRRVAELMEQVAETAITHDIMLEPLDKTKF